MSVVNRQFRLAARPVGLPTRNDWRLTEEPTPEPGAGEFLVKILYISLDPAMRGWMNEGRSYIAPVGIGEVMRAGAVGRVITSKHSGFAVGDDVYGSFGVQEYALSNGGGVTKVDRSLAPLPVFLGALGSPGMTAYFGLLDIGKPQPGQTASSGSPAAPRSAAISSPNSASTPR
jgi:NADPH-dependent curcumin reductase CurA